MKKPPWWYHPANRDPKTNTVPDHRKKPCVASMMNSQAPCGISLTEMSLLHSSYLPELLDSLYHNLQKVAVRFQIDHDE